jgi:hypothetical protein
MILDGPELGISQREYDGFLVAVARQRRLLERNHGEPWAALLEDVDERGGRPTRVVVRLVPVSELTGGLEATGRHRCPGSSNG